MTNDQASASSTSPVDDGGPAYPLATVGNRIFVDCEFNGFGGELISMAFVHEDGREWYGVRRHPKVWDKWVFENVYPILNDRPMGRDEFRLSAISWLQQFENPTIVADWYTDLVHFFELFAGENHSESVGYACKAELILLDSYHSEMPHNALSDARAIRSALLTARKGGDRP